MKEKRQYLRWVFKVNYNSLFNLYMGVGNEIHKYVVTCLGAHRSQDRSYSQRRTNRRDGKEGKQMSGFDRLETHEGGGQYF